jgi:hexosaminidase
MEGHSISNINVIPNPIDIIPLRGTFRLNSETRIEVDRGTKAVGSYLHQLIYPATGCLLQLKEKHDSEARTGMILLTTSGAETLLGDEGYELSVTSDSIILRALKENGLFYGVQTIRQLLPPEIENRQGVHPQTWEIPAVAIKDKPRFGWRGLMLDVGRHFFPVEFIKRLIDILALHKMNVLHWHLTEDQGWRIEIKRYPKLTEIGSKRKASPIITNRNELDGTPYEGFYTQDQIREVVQYASGRFITVVPEIEMPGHSLAALASYPELGCTGGPYEVRAHWGIEEQVYCAGNEKVYEFLENVLDEVTQLFPSKFIHIGGDECPKQLWRQCPKCQALIKQAQLKDESNLQSYFIKRIETILNARDRRLIGWDEILEGGLPPNASVMSWRGIEGGVIAASSGHNVVMCPTSHCYFNYYQSREQEKEPPASRGFIALEKVYSYDPVPSELPSNKESHILGAQGNVWTEYMPNEHQVEYMTFPRTCALSEVLWSSSHSLTFEDFMKRLPVHLSRLRNLGINYRDPFSDGIEKKPEPDTPEDVNSPRS